MAYPWIQHAIHKKLQSTSSSSADQLGKRKGPDSLHHTSLRHIVHILLGQEISYEITTESTSRSGRSICFERHSTHPLSRPTPILPSLETWRTPPLHIQTRRLIAHIMDSGEADEVLGQWYLEQTRQGQSDRPGSDGIDSDDADFEDFPNDEDEDDAEYFDAEEGDYDGLPLQALIGEHFGHQHAAGSEVEDDHADLDEDEEEQDDEDEYNDGEDYDDDEEEEEPGDAVNNILAPLAPFILD
ncbi:hypothetical protein ACRALDRAFT_207614 [Sodiomyces alcalophilus JCM 7366]|uniref:uncharacterized protein n=1 Tax=Sodiomyces alcalophilus JCM 7366 TaxID=591952 RepID=UPI0039B3A79D